MGDAVAVFVGMAVAGTIVGITIVGVSVANVVDVGEAVAANIMV